MKKIVVAIMLACSVAVGVAAAANPATPPAAAPAPITDTAPPTCGAGMSKLEIGTVKVQFCMSAEQENFTLWSATYRWAETEYFQLRVVVARGASPDNVKVFMNMAMIEQTRCYFLHNDKSKCLDTIPGYLPPLQVRIVGATLDHYIIGSLN